MSELTNTVLVKPSATTIREVVLAEGVCPDCADGWAILIGIEMRRVMTRVAEAVGQGVLLIRGEVRLSGRIVQIEVQVLGASIDHTTFADNTLRYKPIAGVPRAYVAETNQARVRLEITKNPSG